MSIDTNLIAWITGLSVVGPNLTDSFVDKDQDKKLVHVMKNKYGIKKSNQGHDVATIDDVMVHFVVWFLVGKVLRKS